MKKFLLTFVAFSMLTLSSVPAFAQTQTSQILHEIPVTAEIIENVVTEVVHADGTTEELKPEYKLYKVGNSARSATGEQSYMLEVKQSYKNSAARSNGSDSDYDSAKADADVTGVIWFTRNTLAGDVLDRAQINFTSGSGVQVYSRTLYYKGNGTAGTSERSKSIGMNHDQYFTGVQGGAGLGVTVKVTADVESYGVTDTLKISMRS